ncbi:50S ribosomal protein L25/general stress protein Ctc [Limnobacter sp.]|uniref:50S ribosomal protein L25/general stress protein Ctc n=1 Tax=Limnobacter sp. TaxID=2003368 RepID=UPI0025826D1E|nr:50S ribosomal protein L25/general stress protein Ctc [Limnobacter sp.]
MKVVATSRTEQGSGASRRLRRAGQVPGIVYGFDKEAQAISIEHNPLWHSLKKELFHSSVLTLEIDGKAEKVLLRDVQAHPYKQQILHIDFQRVDENVPIHMAVPLHYFGHLESPAVKLHGGQVTFVANQMEVVCLPKDLPEFVKVDCGILDITKRSIHVSDVALPEGVSIPEHGQQDASLVTVKIKNAAAKAAEAAND